MTARRIGEFLFLFAGFSALTALMFWQVLPHLSSSLLGSPEDNLQDFWNSWYAAKGHQGAFFFTRLIRAPEGVSLYYHSFAYPQIFAVWLLSKLFGTALSTLLLLQNLTILASFPLASAGAFYLCRYLCGSNAGAAAGAFIFAFSPWHVEQAMHHAHVAGIEFLPFFVLCYLIALERKSYAWLAGAVCFFALSALSCWYYLFYCFYFLCFHLLYLRVHEHRWPQGWRLLAPALTLAGAALLLSPLILPMLLNGLSQSAYQPGSNLFVADLAAYTAFPPTHALGPWSQNLYGHFTGNDWEDSVYLGLANLALLGLGFWQARKDARRILWYAWGGMIFFAVLASGDALHWMGKTLPIHMPDIVLSKLPFFANVRTPARAIVFVFLFLGLGVAATIASLIKSRPDVFSRAALVVVAALMLMDFYPAHLDTTPFACASALNVLAKDPDRNFGILDLPYGYVETNSYMAAQACHGRPIAQGMVARQLAPTLADHLDVRNLDAQRRQLVAAKIKYVLLHHPVGDMFEWSTQDDGDLAAYRRTYTVVRDDADMTVLRAY